MGDLGMLALSITLFALSLAHTNWPAINRHYSDFIEWCVNSGKLGLCVYGGVCGVIVAAFCYPWGY
jgi:hypothetical protein